MQTLDSKQVRQLLATAKGDRLEALYVLAVTTGARQGELLGAQWEDLNLNEGVWQIRHQLQEVAGRLALVEPKTAKSRRQVHLPALAVMALLDHRERMRKEKRTVETGYAFVDTAGTPIRKSNLRWRSFEPLLAEAKLPRIRFHPKNRAGDARPQHDQHDVGHPL